MTSNNPRRRRSSEQNKQVSAKNLKKRAMLRFGGLGAILFGTFAAATVFTSSEAQAGDCLDAFGQVIPGCTPSIPEISALEGTAALAVIAATLLIVWERRRRAM